MNTDKKVRVTIAMDKQAHDLMVDVYGAGQRGQGQFLSRLVMEHHQRRSRQLPDNMTESDLIYEIRRLVAMLQKIVDD